MVIFILVGLALVCLGCWLYFNYGSSYDFWPIPVGFAAGLILLIGLVLIPSQRLQSRAFIIEHLSLQQSISGRMAFSDMERIAVFQKIIESNAKLAKMQFYNTGFVDIYIADEVMDLEPISGL